VLIIHPGERGGFGAYMEEIFQPPLITVLRRAADGIGKCYYATSKI
jgi:hypothetical protein